MAISLRLKAIAKYTEGFDSLADIACDHGYLGIYAAKNYGLKEVLLTDINPMPLASAIANSEKNNLTDVITCKLGNGLAPLDHDYDVISISGIGGILLKEILTNDIERCKGAKRLILCPNTDLYEVRKFLAENMFMIEIEEVVYEYKFYQIIVAKYVGNSIIYNELELKYGPKLLENKGEEFIRLYKEQLKFFENQLKQITDVIAKEKISSKILKLFI